VTNLFCTSCGHLLKETSRFCPECGSIRELVQEITAAQVAERMESKIEAPVDSSPIGGRVQIFERLKTKPRNLVVVGAVGLGALLLIAIRLIGGSESSVDTTPVTESSVVTIAPTIPTPVNRYLELGQIESSCADDELWWSDSSLRFEINGDSSGATVADAWKYRGRENLIVQCGAETPVSVAIVLKLEPDRLRLIASESAFGTFVERASDTVARVGVPRSCCYPDIPLETASVFRFQFRGQIEIDTRAILRFDAWDVANWRCKSMNDPVWGDGEDLDGYEFSDAESGYLTVCSESSEIFDLQEILVDKGYDIEIDGQFGPGTLNALLDFAEENDKVGVEGVVLVDGDFRYARHRS
jgi:RNA polymerase subunit RPABC4/transcription elongation factor Spt4